MIGDMFATRVETIVAPLGFSVTMLVLCIIVFEAILK